MNTSQEIIDDIWNHISDVPSAKQRYIAKSADLIINHPTPLNNILSCLGGLLRLVKTDNDIETMPFSNGKTSLQEKHV